MVLKECELKEAVSSMHRWLLPVREWNSKPGFPREEEERTRAAGLEQSLSLPFSILENSFLC